VVTVVAVVLLVELPPPSPIWTVAPHAVKTTTTQPT
jgi:hypothetical protein